MHGVIHHFYQRHLAADQGAGPIYGHFASKDFVRLGLPPGSAPRIWRLIGKKLPPKQKMAGVNRGNPNTNRVSELLNMDALCGDSAVQKRTELVTASTLANLSHGIWFKPVFSPEPFRWNILLAVRISNGPICCGSALIPPLEPAAKHKALGAAAGGHLERPG